MQYLFMLIITLCAALLEMFGFHLISAVLPIDRPLAISISLMIGGVGITSWALFTQLVREIAEARDLEHRYDRFSS